MNDSPWRNEGKQDLPEEREEMEEAFDDADGKRFPVVSAFWEDGEGTATWEIGNTGSAGTPIFNYPQSFQPNISQLSNDDAAQNRCPAMWSPPDESENCYVSLTRIEAD